MFSTGGQQVIVQLQLRLQCNSDAAASATAAVESIFCAGLCGICISLGVSGVTDTLAPKRPLSLQLLPSWQSSHHKAAALLYSMFDLQLLDLQSESSQADHSTVDGTDATAAATAAATDAICKILCMCTMVHCKWYYASDSL